MNQPSQTDLHMEDWYGMVWYGMVWYGMVWYWYGTGIDQDAESIPNYQDQVWSIFEFDIGRSISYITKPYKKLTCFIQ